MDLYRQSAFVGTGFTILFVKLVGTVCFRLVRRNQFMVKRVDCRLRYPVTAEKRIFNGIFGIGQTRRGDRFYGFGFHFIGQSVRLFAGNRRTCLVIQRRAADSADRPVKAFAVLFASGKEINI